MKGLQATSTGSRSGCGRAYVCLCKTDKKQVQEFKKAVEACGLRYLPKAYGVGNRAAYIGYDNADGRALAQAEAVASNLRKLGLDCYDDAMGD